MNGVLRRVEGRISVCSRVEKALLTSLDPVENRVDDDGCALQILRSLCAQSVRYVQLEKKRKVQRLN